MAIELKGRQVGAFIAALTSAFPGYPKLQLLARIELDVPLSDIAAPGPLREVAAELVSWAEAQGRVEDLLTAALTQAPRSPRLLALAYELSLTSSRPPESRLESIVLPTVPMVDVAQWRAEMELREPSVCRIEIPAEKPAGSGFLVAPDLILTNYHVASCIESRQTSASQCIARFGYMTDSGGLAVSTGDTATFCDNCIVQYSPVAVLDYAVMRLATALTRPLIPRPQSHSFAAGEVHLILHHPVGSPLKLSVGTATQIDQAKKRVSYTVNTEPGSSGSPVFTLDWKPVALHQRGSADANCGIFLWNIAERLSSEHLWT